MFRNQYDNDVSTFSPQGRLHQIEYALEAVKQGSACVGIRSKHYAVLVSLQRQGGELSSYHKKTIKVDNHMGIAFAGLTSDARVLSNFMRTECMRHKVVFARPLSTFRAAMSVADKAQANTQGYGSRPYGVGFLVAGVDLTGPHLYEFSPSATALEYVAQSIGSRSQSARTYLEKHVDAFADCSLDRLIQHGLAALRDTLPSDKELTVENVAIATVGREEGEGGALIPFHILKGDELETHIRTFTLAYQAAHPPTAAAEGGDAAGGSSGGDAPMDTSE